MLRRVDWGWVFILRDLRARRLKTRLPLRDSLDGDNLLGMPAVYAVRGSINGVAGPFNLAGTVADRGCGTL